MTGGLKMGVNVAAHTRYISLGSAPPMGVYTCIHGRPIVRFVIYHCPKAVNNLVPSPDATLISSHLAT